MQKKNRLISILVLILVTVMSSVCLTACGGDDDEPKTDNTALSGKWRFDHATVNAMGLTTNVSLSQIKDAMPANTYLWDEVIEFKDGKMNGVAYTLKGNKFSFNDYPEFGKLGCSVKISESELVFHYDMKELTGQDITENLYYHPF